MLHSGLSPAWRPTRCAVVDLPLHSRRRTGRDLSGQPTVAPHGVTCYIQRLPVAHNASPEAMTRAAAMGMVLPHGYTFVDAYVWLRMADVRSLATALRTTVALSSLRAILQADHHRRSEGTAAERDPHRDDNLRTRSPRRVARGWCLSIRIIRVPCTVASGSDASKGLHCCADISVSHWKISGWALNLAMTTDFPVFACSAMKNVSSPLVCGSSYSGA